MWKRRAPGCLWSGRRAERRAYLAGVKRFGRIPPLALVAGLLLSAAPAVGSSRVPGARRGLAMLQHFNDSLPRSGGNGLRCTSCHLDDGRRGSAMPWVGVTSRYPKYRSRRGGTHRAARERVHCAQPGRSDVGAGMARQHVLATFLRWNMPYDLAGTLSAQDASDIAAWLLRRPRPDHPGRERDWPNGDPPSDVPMLPTVLVRADWSHPSLARCCAVGCSPTRLPNDSGVAPLFVA